MQAELAQREIDSGHGDAEAVKRSLRQIALSRQRAAHMVNQLLAMARAEDEEQDAACQPFDLAALATRGGSRLVPRALEKGIDLGYEGPEAGAPTHPASVGRGRAGARAVCATWSTTRCSTRPRAVR